MISNPTSEVRGPVDDEPRPSAPATGADPGPADADSDGWFAGGYDAAHAEYLAALTHSDDAGRARPAGPAVSDESERVEMLSAAEAAARLEQLATPPSAGGRVDEADTARDDGRDAPVEDVWWAPTGPDEVALSQREVAEELTERGFTPEQARTAITEYLDETSDRIGISVHQWAMDSHDVEAIAHIPRRPVSVPEQRRLSTAEQTAAVRGRGDRCSDEQMTGVATHVRTTHGPDRPVEVEADRREQLVRWHSEGTAAGPDRRDGRGDEVLIFEGRQ
jgi:hypothetical protein